uniref:ELMO/CED-12 domain containing 2 n=1 Tax=Neolamprologus brichardi TaxID=32507 RepID=A0A3Q4GS75_NEOBR
MFGYIWEYVYTSFLRYWLKWLIRQVTGTCELQRICSGHKPGAARTTKAGALNHPKSVLRGALETTKDSLEQCVDQIMKAKNIKPAKDPKFKESLHICLLQITGYSSLYISVEDLRKEVFSSDNPEHEAMLLKVWIPAPRAIASVSACQTDLTLSFFSENYTAEARQVLSHANHPKLGYSYAIVGINLTEMAYSLLKSGALKPHFYNAVQGTPELQHFHQLYCYLAYEFDKFWVAEEPESIMQFNQYREKFHNIVRTHLQDPGVCLTLTVGSKN